MSPQLVGGWGQAEPLAAGEEGGAWPPTASSHRREQAPGAQPALGRSACFWHQKGVVVSCQCPGPQVGLHRGPAPGPATGAAPQLQALSRHRPLLYLALDLSASQLLYQTVSSWWQAPRDPCGQSRRNKVLGVFWHCRALCPPSLRHGGLPLGAAGLPAFGVAKAYPGFLTHVCQMPRTFGFCLQRGHFC